MIYKQLHKLARAMSVLVVLISVPLAANAQSAADADIEHLTKRLSEQFEGMSITSVSTSPVPGLYEFVSDGQIYYVDRNADYLLDGSMIDLNGRVNLTEGRLGQLHTGLIEEIGEDNMLIYEPSEPSDRSITVFTDISCGYCRRLHQDIDGLLDAGVRVRYLLFPRAGLDSEAHAALESVWCADNPQEAMTRAKSGQSVEPATCDNPIAEHVSIAERIGLRGTPLIYLDTGDRIPGYREPATIADMVNQGEPLL